MSNAGVESLGYSKYHMWNLANGSRPCLDDQGPCETLYYQFWNLAKCRKDLAFDQLPPLVVECCWNICKQRCCEITLRRIVLVWKRNGKTFYSLLLILNLNCMNF